MAPKNAIRYLSIGIPRHDGPRNGQRARIAPVGPLPWLSLLLAALFMVSLWASPSIAEDNDYPHNYVQNASCNTGTCHFGYGPEKEAGDLQCLFCHDDTDPAYSLPAPTVVGHSSATTSTKYGAWAVQCIDCHHEHLQMQYWAYGEESYVFTGVSDPGGITETTLTMTGAGWEEDCFAGMVLFPNIDDPYADYSNYGIIGNTTDTITVKGPMLLNGGGWDTPIGTGGKNFAVIYGKGINANVPDEAPTRPVRFFRPEGVNSFADGDATYDGICEVCHTQTSHHRNDGTAPYQSHSDGAQCTACHPHASGFKPVAMDHTAGGVVLPTTGCLECHGSLGPDLVGGVHGGQCGLCHLDPGGAGPLVEPLESSLPNGGSCTDCHGPLIGFHGAIDHTAEPGSGLVVIFPDDGHDDAGWIGSKPYFGISVACGTCHTTNLPEAHGNDCSTCHPTPYETLVADGGWTHGCQQGGCHVSFHADSATAHETFENPSDSTNDCSRCHLPDYSVTGNKCLNCHANPATQDLTAPVTSTNALSSYVGSARIVFSITDGGLVGVGRTFYKLDGSGVSGGSSVEVSSAGQHTLEFWSVDQAGNQETPAKSLTFSITEDTTPPTTTSNAQPDYQQGAKITLTATDNSTLGVKSTFFRINGGSIQTGAIVDIPRTSGTISYTLEFWSEDWAGNIEIPNSVNFTVSSGDVTFKLVWTDCDNYPANAPKVGDSASWTIRRGSWTGPVVKTGSAASPGWSGIDYVSVPISTTPYYLVIDWTWAEENWSDQTSFQNIDVSSPGSTIRISY